MGDDIEVTVVDNPDRSRYEALVGGEVAGFVTYRRDGERVVLVHTEVDDAQEGRGVGSSLAKGALDLIRADGQRVVPRCPFIKRYVERHDEYKDLVA